MCFYNFVHWTLFSSQSLMSISIFSTQIYDIPLEHYSICRIFNIRSFLKSCLLNKTHHLLKMLHGKI